MRRGLLLKGRAVEFVLLALAFSSVQVVVSLTTKLWRPPLPYTRPGEVFRISLAKPEEGKDWALVSPRMYRSLEESIASLELGAYQRKSGTLAREGKLRYVELALVSENLLPLLGRQGEVGRGFSTNGDREIVLSWELSQSLFSSAREASGALLSIEGNVYHVSGVMARDFRFPPNRPSEAFLVLDRSAFATNRGDEQSLILLGRLVRGSLKEARAELERLGRQLESEEGMKGWTFSISPYSEILTRSAREPVSLLSAGATLVLIVTATSVASLRGASVARRRWELGIRSALGASPGQVRFQLVREGALMVVTISLLTSCLAMLALGWLSRLHVQGLDLLGEVKLHPLASGITLGGMLLLEIGHTASVSTGRRLPYQLRGRSRVTRRRARLLVTALALQIGAASAVLGFAAGFAKDYLEIIKRSSGVEEEQSLGSFRISVPTTREALESALAEFLTLPALRAVALTSVMPFSGYGEYDVVRGQREVPIEVWSVSDSYFATTGVHVLLGDWPSEGVAINETAATRLFGVRPRPLGRSLWLDKRRLSVGAVVADVRHWGLHSPAPPILYKRLDQALVNGAWIVFRPFSDFRSSRVAIEQTLARHGLTSSRFTTAEELLSKLLSPFRFRGIIYLYLSAVALLIAWASSLAFVARLIIERHAEFAIRAALGAESRDLVGLVLRRLCVALSSGVVLGFGIWVVGWRVLVSRIAAAPPFWVEGFAASAAVLAAGVILGSLLPMREILRADPGGLLRNAT